MVKLVQATPEELDAFSKKCAAKVTESSQAISQVVTEVENLRAQWGGAFTKAFGGRWAVWQKDMKEFPTEVDKTSTEMAKLAVIYRQADDEAAAATKSVPGVGP